MGISHTWLARRRPVLAGLLWLLLTGAGAPVLAGPAEQGIRGEWLSPAEDADDVDAIIAIAPRGRLWSGHIQAIPRPRHTTTSAATSGPTAVNDTTPCQACPGAQRGQPMRGLEVMWGLREQDGKLVGGKILDPGDGTVYDCEIALSSDGNTLQVTAYKGLKLLGRTLSWRRVNAVSAH